jgi:ribosomal protein L1
MIRTTISLPNGSGKTSKICAFTDGNAKDLEKA